MNGSNIDPRNWTQGSPLRGSYLLIAVVLAGFGGLSKAQATNAAPPPDPALTGNFGRMLRTVPPFAPPTNACRSALLGLGSPGGIIDANDCLAARPVPLIVDPKISLVSRNNRTPSPGVTFLR